jgi:hypothetical protein
MVVDLSPGDVIRFGDDITLTVLAVGNGLVRFGLESPDKRQGADMDCEGGRPQAVARLAGIELNRVANSRF